MEVKPVRASTFSSITTPIGDVGLVKELLGELKAVFPRLQSLYLPWISTIPLNKGLRWMPTWKSLPNSDKQFVFDRAQRIHIVEIRGSSLRFAIAFDSFLGGSPGIMFVKRVLWPLDIQSNTQARICAFMTGLVFDQLASAYEGVYLRPGRFAQVIEGAGKRRLFYIVTYDKQRLLRPVHDWAMSV